MRSKASLWFGFHGGTWSDFLVFQILLTKRVSHTEANAHTPPSVRRVLADTTSCVGFYLPGVPGVKRLPTAPRRTHTPGQDAAGDNDAESDPTRGHLLSLTRHEKTEGTRWLPTWR